MRNPHYFEAILDYAEKMTSNASSYLENLERETHLKMLSPQMVSGTHLGRFLSMMSQIRQPNTILEIGTFTGYATFCLLEGLKENGTIHTIEVNIETKWLFNKYRSLIDKNNQVHRYDGDALTLIPGMDIHPNLVWIDAGKKDNMAILEMVLPKMSSGDVIMVDNTLWSGKVLKEEKDAQTQIIHDFNDYLSNHEHLQTFFVPIRDGVTICILK